MKRFAPGATQGSICVPTPFIPSGHFELAAAAAAGAAAVAAGLAAVAVGFAVLAAGPSPLGLGPLSQPSAAIAALAARTSPNLILLASRECFQFISDLGG